MGLRAAQLCVDQGRWEGAVDACHKLLMLLLPKFVAGFSGQFVDAWGYEPFFMGTALLGLPVLVLVWLAGRAQRGGDGNPPKAPNNTPLPF
jgi:hypothetical protein